MSFFQPKGSIPTTASAMPAPLFEMKGQWADLDLGSAIGTAVMILGLLRLDSAAIVQDLHAGAFGVGLIFASLIAFFATRKYLVRNLSKPFSTSGIFAISRNPALLAFFAPLASLAYFDWQTAAACIVIYVLAMNLTVIRKDERDQQHVYGEGFTAYRTATPRWFA